jgi:WD40 repeat protein
MYDAFISYSHLKDKPLAVALQSAMQKIGKPWYWLRALRIYRDEASQGATSTLWKDIEQALEQSRYFILLVSPEAAASPWVNKEVIYWLKHKRAATLLIALTDGELLWDNASGDFISQNGTVVPPALKRQLLAEPKWVDLRQYREAANRRDAGFIDRAAEFAATIHGIPKEDLLSLEIRQQRRARTLAWSAVTLLTVLMVIAAWQWNAALKAEHVAIEQRRVAVQNEERAIAGEEEARKQEKQAKSERDNALILQSRFLADLANQYAQKGDTTTAMLLAMEALPGASSRPLRPYVAEAEMALSSLWRSGARNTLVLRGHEGPLTTVSFSPDGKQIVTASRDKTARLWDATTGKELFVLQGHEGDIGIASFSPDGRRLITAAGADWFPPSSGSEAPPPVVVEDNDTEQKLDTAAPDPIFQAPVDTSTKDTTARLWDVANGRNLHVLRGHDSSLTHAAFSLDGTRVLTASLDKTARLWDANSGKVLVILRGHTDSVLSAAFTPDGRRVVTGSKDKTARVWDSASGKAIFVLRGHTNEVRIVAISSDGQRIMTVDAQTVRVWETATGKQIFLIREQGVFSAAFSPRDYRIVTASSRGGMARLWDDAGREVLLLHTSDSPTPVLRFWFSQDGTRIVTEFLDGKARVFDATSGQQTMILGESSNGSMVFPAAAFSPDGKTVVAASFDATALVWDVRGEDRELLVLRGHEGEISSVVFSPDAKWILSSSKDKTARVWNSKTGNEILVLRGHEDSVGSAAFSPDSRMIVTASDDLTARLWDVTTGAALAIVRGTSPRFHWRLFTQEMQFVEFSHDGRRVIIINSRNDSQNVWDVTSKQVIELVGHDLVANFAAFSPDGMKLVTASGDKTARVWDVQSGKEILVLHGHDDAVNTAVFSPDGTRILTASSDKTARVWDGTGGKILVTFRKHSAPVRHAEFSPDGKLIVTASEDSTARLWDATTGIELAVMKELEEKGLRFVPCIFCQRADAALFSPDGHRVLMINSEGPVLIRDAASGKTISVLEGHSAAFSPAGTQVVTASGNTARVWRVPTVQELIGEMKRLVRVCLTREQRETAFLDPEPPTWCVEMEKSPYHTQDWKEWLRFKQADTSPPLPDTPEWQPWVTAHQQSH